MSDKKARFATLLFIGITLLPLLALVMMDYQLKQANDLTGAYVAGPSAYAAENVLAGAVVLGVLVAALLLFVVSRVRKARMVHTMPLSRINEEIRRIDDHLKGH